MPEWVRNCWYDCCYALAWTMLTVANSFRFEGRHNLPPTGPALLVANHESFLDPLAVGGAVQRRLSFLARKTLFTHPLAGAWLRSVNSVPVDQEGVAKEGLKAILDRLEKGEAVLVFPEGERSWTGEMQPLKPGIALLIKRTAVPIIPVGIAGAFEALPRQRPWPRFAPLFLPARPGAIAVAVGKPLDGRRFADLPREQMLRALFDEIRKMVRRAEELRRKP